MIPGLLVSRVPSLGALLLPVLVASSPSTGLAEPEAKPPEEFRETCERRLKPTSIEVEVSEGGVTYDTSKSVAELTRMQEPSGTTIHALGLTKANYRFESSVRVNLLSHPRADIACMRPAIAVTLKVGPQTVFIAKEFPPGSCAYREIAEHERRHVKVNQEHLKSTADFLRQEMTAHYGKQIFYGPAESMKKKVFSDVEDVWMTRAQRKFDESKADHRAIDSPEEYKRNATMCDGAVAEVLRR